MGAEEYLHCVVTVQGCFSCASWLVVLFFLASTVMADALTARSPAGTLLMT